MQELVSSDDPAHEVGARLSARQHELSTKRLPNVHHPVVGPLVVGLAPRLASFVNVIDKQAAARTPRHKRGVRIDVTERGVGYDEPAVRRALALQFERVHDDVLKPAGAQSPSRASRIPLKILPPWMYGRAPSFGRSLVISSRIMHSAGLRGFPLSLE